MPLYDYTCRSCGQTFEALVSASRVDEVSCQACGSDAVTRSELSLFAVGGGPSARPQEACNSCQIPGGPSACSMAGPSGAMGGCPSGL